MDAREYLNRKGVPLDRDADRPNTLEEKSWERAREAGQQRPKVGTPHDWEEWERYHEDLAHDADALTQKIDKDAHRKTTVNDSSKAEATPAVDKSVEFFTPEKPSDNESAPQSPPLTAMPSSVKAAYYALAVLFPPLAVALTEGGARRVAITTLLTLCVWLPGVVFAFVWLRRQ
ncbi:YqaE/Pmp3 family membrane protein [Halomonas sp. SH5A2]|uniref:YqaE/Pmp3 family membrane protein n=1 Tax=Halomonas sp. SH5A2 TaxID=2749040 RepID=UPI001640A7C2|nr:YqaE/Pmp3 family membrane protein [Halomonas sp. SH5A2]QNI03381.1 YqaE/Pmp3 family membrane protein [Halomonas sp. SH5A2]